MSELVELERATGGGLLGAADARRSPTHAEASDTIDPVSPTRQFGIWALDCPISSQSQSGQSTRYL